MIFNIDLGELSLLLAVTAIILLVTSELFAPYHRKLNVNISRKKLRKAAVFFSFLFVMSILARILGML
jgi:hypothetical protein